MRARIYIEYYGVCSTGDSPKLYLDWYKHSDRHKYKGFTIQWCILGWTANLTFVNDGKLYQEMKDRYSRRR